MERIEIPKDYEPSSVEEYMNPKQLEYFLRKLEEWKKKVLEECDRTIKDLKNLKLYTSDVAQDSHNLSSSSDMLRRSDRSKKLLKKIDSTIKKIENGSYGYCIKTGKPIGIERLKARPVATLCLEEQEDLEVNEGQSIS